MSGEDRRNLVVGWLVATALIWSAATVNVFTTADDSKLDLIWPAIWEYTSAVSNMIAMAIAWAAVRWITLRPRGWAHIIAIHALCVLAYSLLHVGIFVALREAIYAAMGRDYEIGAPARFLYEFRKDIIGYTVICAAFWGAARLGRASSAIAAAPTTFDILDGARLLRVETSDILAVTAAGNYAEFILADGRRPLMRTSLAALEEKLGAAGFVRTHRSWLVNPTRVTGMRPDGSGDYTVELGAVEAPLSRRFPEATARLRGA